MQTLQEATEKICDLKGSLIALECLMNALLRAVPASVLPAMEAGFVEEAELARAVLLGELMSEHVLLAFERDVQRASAKLTKLQDR